MTNWTERELDVDFSLSRLLHFSCWKPTRSPSTLPPHGELDYKKTRTQITRDTKLENSSRSRRGLLRAARNHQ